MFYEEYMEIIQATCAFVFFYCSFYYIFISVVGSLLYYNKQIQVY